MTVTIKTFLFYFELNNKQLMKTNLFDSNQLVLMNIWQVVQSVKEVLTTCLLQLNLLFPLLPSGSKITLTLTKPNM